MLVSKSIEVDYGHTLSQHYGFCNQLHGHRATVTAVVEGGIQKDKGSSQGMVMDFKFIKELLMKEVHEVLDHGFAVWKEDKEDVEYIKKRNKKYLVMDEPPTAECLAKWTFNKLESKIPEGMKLVKIRWYETPNSIAIYTADDWGMD